MKKYIIKVVFIALFFSSISFSQWSFINPPYPQSSSFLCLSFADKNVGWAAGDLGTIIKTTDGGLNWEAQESNVFGTISSISFINSDYGWALCGNDVLRTTNGGKTWSLVYKQIDSYSPLLSINFVDATHGWAVGRNAKIFKTSDGGISWTLQTAFGSIIFHSVYFTDINNGVAVGDYTIVKTSDGGKNWKVALSIPQGNSFLSVYFINSKIGWAVGSSGIIKKTTDGGDTWSDKKSRYTGTLLSVIFANENFGCAASNNGIILISKDGGESWTIKQNVKSSATSIFFSDTLNGTIVGYGGVIQNTSDGGNTWNSIQKFVTLSDMKSVYFPTSKLGYTVGSSCTILKSTDTGDSWQLQNTPSTDNLLSVYFLNETEGFAVGENGALLSTTDGGVNWIKNNSGVTVSLTSIRFSDQTTGFIVGNKGLILRTSDRGKNWTSVSSGTTYNLNAVCFADANTGWITGDGDALLKTTDNGNSWFFQLSRAGYLSSPCFINAKIGWVCTGFYEPYLLKTLNSGSGWIIQDNSVNLGRFIKDLYFGDENTGWLFCDQGYVLNTSDGGTTWNRKRVRTVNTLNSAFFVDSKTIIAVGDGGTIIKTTTGGIVSATNGNDQRLPDNFLLYQNYPNPFNPTTTIKYSIPSSSHIKLTIYNMLGQIVKELVNETKPAGTYQVEFDGSSLSSGVYFYSLRTNNFCKTNKFILLK
jgi:photosystem II stability/assembly factor-like uncharacterized protein